MRAMRQLLQHTIQFGNPGFCVTRLAAADQGDQITRALHEIAVCLVQFGVAWSTLEPCNPAKHLLPRGLGVEPTQILAARASSSAERRVGKECVNLIRSRWSHTHEKKKLQKRTLT